MIVFLSGCHGVGKTTFINNLNIGKPLIKIVDTDLIPFNGIGLRQQTRRIVNFDRLLSHWNMRGVPPYDVIVDRSPFDFYVYNKHASHISGEDIEDILNSEMKYMMNYYWGMEDICKIVGVTRDFNEILENINKRNRNMWNESDENYCRMVYHDFELLFAHNGNAITKVEYHNLDHYVKQLFI